MGWYLSGTLVIPDRYIILRSGTLGLLFLIASFACTPLRHFTGWHRTVQVRRPIGLYGFLFVLIHFGIYAVFENRLDVAQIRADQGERTSMLIGIFALLLLIPLAVTSTRGWKRRLGRRWRMLHWLVYPTILLSVWHYLWLNRDFKRTPFIYLGIASLLLLLRLPFLRSVVKLGLNHKSTSRRNS